MLFIVFVTVFVVAIGTIYLMFAIRQNYPAREIIEYLEKLQIEKPSIISLRNVIRKVNGWNYMTSIYSILYYSLNVLSITYTCIGIYYSFQPGDVSFVASVSSLISLCLNLFFHCGNKWGNFRKVLAKSRFITEDFLKNIINCNDIVKLINEYAIEIINLEKNIKNSDLI